MQLVHSEQDFQSNALSSLRSNVFNTAGNGIYRYHFRTKFNPDRDGAALEVEWFADGSDNWSVFGRSLEENDAQPGVVRVVDNFYDDGTVRRTHELIQKDEVNMIPMRIWGDRDDADVGCSSTGCSADRGMSISSGTARRWS